MTIAAAAELLGVHYMTAYKYVRTGRVEARKSGSRWLVSQASVEALSSDRATPGSAVEVTAGCWQGHRRVHRSRLLHALINGDEAGAWVTIESALASGADLDTVEFDLLSPVMHAIGDGWVDGTVSIADEHCASTVAHRVLGTLGSRTRRRGRHRGTVVIATVAGDHHALPTAVLRGPWARHGYHVIDLGSDTPAESIVSAARRDDLVAVGLSASAPGNDHAIASTLRYLTESVPGVVLLLGGQAINDATHATELGADHYGASGQDGLNLLDDLTTANTSTYSRD